MGRRKNAEQSIRNWKVALYIRLSKEDGNDVSLSVENQRETLMHYLDNSDEELELVDIYIDDGRTGTDSDRPDFQRMLADIDRKRINCVIVKDTSRLSRNYAEAGIYMEQYFVEKNIRFISLYLPSLDSYLRPEEISSIATAMQNVINDDFCRQTSLKIRGVFNIKRSKGLFIGSFACYGYKKDPNDRYRLVIDEAVAENVRNIYRWFINGMSKRAIARKLNALGILNPVAYKKSIGLKYTHPSDKFGDSVVWNVCTIDSILKNQIYTGDMVQGKSKVISYKIHKQVNTPKDEWFIVPNTHDAIVERSVFDKAQEIMARDVKSINRTGEVSMFAGLLRCSGCKKALHKKTGGKYKYYVCGTFKISGGKVCSKHTIREDRLTEAVLHAINTQIGLVGNVETIIREIENTPKTKNAFVTLEKAFQQKEKDIAKINMIRDGLYRDWKSGDITREDYLRLRESYDKELLALRDGLKLLKEEIEQLRSSFTTDTDYFQHFKKHGVLEHLERSILIDLIDAIYIGENQDIEIKFRFVDQQKRLLSLIEQNGEYEKINKLKLSF